MLANKERIVWIDRMRGLAILSVIMQHLTIGQFTNDYVYLRWIGCANMPIFFFISAFLMVKTSHFDSFHSLVLFAFKKSCQLMIPFLVWPLIINRFVFKVNWSWLTFQDVVDEFVNPHLWFFLTLYGFCFIFILYKFLDKKGKTILAIVVPIIICLILNLLFLKFHILKNAAIYSWYFVAGIIISRFNLVHWFTNRIVSASSLLLIFFTLMFWQPGTTSPLTALIKLEVSFASICLIYIFCIGVRWPELLDRMIKRFGVYSLAIYVSHWTFLTVFTPKIQFVNNELIALLLIGLFSMIVGYVCILFCKFVENIPYIHFLMFGSKPNNSKTL